jgi:four helix bundle protein
LSVCSKLCLKRERESCWAGNYCVQEHREGQIIDKMGIVEEEIDETIYWLELLIEVGILKAEEAEAVLKEANELLAIVVASIKTARKNK